MSFRDIQGNASETPESSPETVAVTLSHPGVCAGQEAWTPKKPPFLSSAPLLCLFQQGKYAGCTTDCGAPADGFLCVLRSWITLLIC